MRMFDNLATIYDTLVQDSELWKLLYHKSKSLADDPLLKDDVLSLPHQQRLEIIEKRLKFTPSTSDLAEDDDNGICRIIFYPSPRSPQVNYFVADQQVDIEIFVHKSFNDVDMRLAKICDRVNELFTNKRVTGMGKIKFISGKPFVVPNKGYIGYTFTIQFGDGSANA